MWCEYDLGFATGIETAEAERSLPTEQVARATTRRAS